MTKMKPIFFPFTHIREEDAAALLACFTGFYHFTVKSLSEIEFHDPAIDTILPDKEDILPTLAMVEDYKSWASINQGRAGQLKSRVPDAPYFTSDTGISFLKSTIERGARSQGLGIGMDILASDHGSGKDSAKKFADGSSTDSLDSKKDEFIKSLVFLRMAQESDAEFDQIDKKLGSIAKSEAELFSALKGLDIENTSASFFSGKNQIQDEDQGSTMTEKRILAWARFFRKKANIFTGSNHLVLVTTSPAVMDYFHLKAKKSIKVLDIENFKVHERSCEHGDELKKRLNNSMENAVLGKTLEDNGLMEAADGCTLLVDIQLYFFSGGGVSDFFKTPMIQAETGGVPVCLVRRKNKKA